MHGIRSVTVTSGYKPPVANQSAPNQATQINTRRETHSSCILGPFIYRVGDIPIGGIGSFQSPMRNLNFGTSYRQTFHWLLASAGQREIVPDWIT